MPESLIFWVCAAGAVVTGVAVFRVDSMARATFALLASFIFAAIPLLLLGLSYLGILVILMMIMEMVVMAVFMIMLMMNPAGLMPMKMVHNQRGSLLIAGGTFAVLAAGVLLVDWPQRQGKPPPDLTVALGRTLMGPHMLVMLAIGLGLFATIVAAVVLAHPRGRYDRFGDDLSRRPAADPGRGAVEGRSRRRFGTRR